MTFIQIDNQQIFYSKEGDGDSILLLHGWGCDSSTLNIIKNNLTNKYACYSVDLCGFGSSLPPLVSFDTVDYAKLVYKLICELNIGKLTIIGHSFGGRIAIIIAAMHPEIVLNLILIGSAGLRINRLSTFIKVKKYKFKKFLVKYHLLKAKHINNVGSDDYKATSGVMKQTFVKVVNQDLSKYARKISCDTLLIYGRNDMQTPIKLAKKLNKLIKKSALVIVENASHYCFLEKPYEVNSIINAMVDTASNEC